MAPGTRERKKLETRAALQDAALRLSIEHGVANVTVDHIAEMADVSTRTFFNHFSCKEEAIVAGHTVRSNQLLPELLRERPADEPIMEALRAANQVMAHEHFPAMMETLQERLVVLRHIHNSPELLPYTVSTQALHEPELAAAIADRTGRDPDKDMECALLASMMLTARRVALMRWVEVPGTPQLEDYMDAVDRALTHFTRGFGNLTTQ